MNMLTSLDALDLAAAALRECRALRTDPEQRALLSAAHDRIQFLRDIELRHGTTLAKLSTSEIRNQQSQMEIVPRDTSAPSAQSAVNSSAPIGK